MLVDNEVIAPLNIKWIQSIKHSFNNHLYLTNYSSFIIQFNFGTGGLSIIYFKEINDLYLLLIEKKNVRDEFHLP